MSNPDVVDIDAIDDKSFIVNMVIDGRHYQGIVDEIDEAEDNELH